MAKGKQKFIDIDGHKICYFDNEAPSKTTIIFIHGNSSSYHSFQNQINGSLGQKYRIIAPDLYGHGQTGRAATEALYSLPGYALLIQSLIQKLDLRFVFLAGHSLGGHIALELAPELSTLLGIFIWGTPPVARPPEMAKAFRPEPATAALFKADSSSSEVLSLMKVFLKENSEYKPELIDSYLNTDPSARQKLSESIGALHYKDEIQILEELNTPIAIASGDSEKIIDENYFKDLDLTKVWKSKLLSLKGGHYCHLEEAEEFNKNLIDFVSEVTQENVASV